jgi:hypothetical protein
LFRGLSALVGPARCPLDASVTPRCTVRSPAVFTGDTELVRALVDDGCADTPVGRAEGVMVMGVRMTIRAVRTQLVSTSATEARLRYTVRGSAQGQNATTRILGATVRIGRVRVANVTQSNVLRLVRANGRWVIACR